MAAALASATAALRKEAARTRAGFTESAHKIPVPDPGALASHLELSDVTCLRKKYSFLKDFSDTFIKSTPLTTLLKMESTSIKIQEFEKKQSGG